jgi:hypothetical protein
MTSMPIVDDVGNPKFIKCKNCDEEVDCDEDGIFCLNYGEHIEINLCQDCFDDKKDKFKKDGWECDDFEDEDEDEDEEENYKKDNAVLLEIVSGNYSNSAEFMKICKKTWSKEFLEGGDDDTGILNQFFLDEEEDKEDEDKDEDKDEYIRKAFLNKYLVPNYYAKEHLCEDYDDERWERFKEFVHESNSSLEEIGFLMDHCKESFEEDEDEDDEDN